MKNFITFAIFCVLAAIVINVSAQNESEVQAQAQAEAQAQIENLENGKQGLLKGFDNPVTELVRTKRLTCSIGEWACVAHCNSLGRKSGGCNRGVCVCRNR